MTLGGIAHPVAMRSSLPAKQTGERTREGKARQGHSLFLAPFWQWCLLFHRGPFRFDFGDRTEARFTTCTCTYIKVGCVTHFHLIYFDLASVQYILSSPLHTSCYCMWGLLVTLELKARFEMILDKGIHVHVAAIARGSTAACRLDRLRFSQHQKIEGRFLAGSHLTNYK